MKHGATGIAADNLRFEGVAAALIVRSDIYERLIIYHCQNGAVSTPRRIGSDIVLAPSFALPACFVAVIAVLTWTTAAPAGCSDFRPGGRLRTGCCPGSFGRVAERALRDVHDFVIKRQLISSDLQ